MYKENYKDFYRLIVIGPTGAGKSQFCNFVQRDTTNSKNMVSDSLNSCTQDPKSNIFERKKTKYEFIDTAGNSDSSDNDETNLKKLIEFLREKKQIDYITLLLKFGERLTKETRDYLNLLGKIFTPWEFYSHLCVFFTKSPIKPKKKEKATQDKLIEEINTILKEIFEVKPGNKLPDIHVYFIDTEYDEDEEKYEEKFQNTVDIMIKQMKLDVYRYQPIDTSELDINGQRKENKIQARLKTVKDLTKLLEEKKNEFESKNKKINKLQEDIELSRKNAINNEEIKKKEKELNDLKTELEEEIKYSEEQLEEIRNKEKLFNEAQKEIDDEAKENGINVDKLDNIIAKSSEIAKYLGIGGGTTFLLGLGGIALSSICPVAAPIISTIFFSSAGGLTLGSAGAGIVALGAKLKKNSKAPPK